MFSQYNKLCAVFAMVALIGAGCGDDAPDNNDQSANNGGSDVSVDADIGVDARPDGEDDADPGIDTEQPAPVITNLTATENPNNVLSAIVEFSTDEDATPSMVVSSIDGSHSFGISPPPGMPTDTHSFGVVGMRAETEYEFTVSATDSDDHTGTSRTTFTTGALPSDFPPVEVTTADVDDIEPGYTLFTVSRWGSAGLDRPWGYIVAVDESGEVIWYEKADHHPYEAIVLSNGNLAYVAGHDAIVEIDWMGEQINEWTVEQLGIDTVHHELLELPNGNLVTLSTEMRSVDGYDDGNGGTTSHNVVGDTIVEINPADGSVAEQWSTFDMLDPMRKGGGFDAPFWNIDYDQVDSTKDWTHANAVEYDPSDDSFIVSIRHHDWLIKFSRADGSLTWKLGEEGDFTLTGSGEWQYHQHAPELQDDGTILLYDNGNGRPGVDPSDLYSRAVQFDVDEATMEVSQVWEYKGVDSFYAPYVSDADKMGNGNVLIADGGRVSDSAAPLAAPDNLKWGRVIEVNDAEPAEVVFELIIRDDAQTDPKNYFIYRAEKLDTFPAAPVGQ
jgi:hypothetical protein